MTFAAISNWLSWDLSNAGAFGSPPTSSVEDWGPSIFGGPTPTGVGVLAFGTSGFLFATPPPVVSSYDSPPYSLDFMIINLGLADLTVALCTGPAPTFDGSLSQWETDPQGLTILQRWDVPASGGFVEQIVSWNPLVSGVYYYFAFEGYTGTELDSEINISAGAVITDVSAGTEYLGNVEQIFPVGQPFDLTLLLLTPAPLPLAIDVDWGDSTTTSRTLTHSGQGSIIDDAYFTTDLALPPIAHIYSARGLFTITITSTDAVGGVQTQTRTVAAVGPPTCSLTVVPPSVGLPGQLAVTASGHSDAWGLLRGLSPPDAPDEYDGTATNTSEAPAFTVWRLFLTQGDGFASDDVTPADWTGPGDPVNGPIPATPLPNQINLPADPGNLLLQASGEPAVVELTVIDHFVSWTQETICTASVRLSPYQTSIPRDDGLGASTLRSWPKPVNSVRSVPRIP